MDYKEKYEMALEGIQEILGSGEDSIKMSRLQLRLQGIFPELKEPEDEKVRKEIIDFLKLPHPQFVGKRDHEKWIAWLEKQGQVKESAISQHENRTCEENGNSLTSEEAIEREVKEDAGGYPYIDATELYDYENDKPLAKAGDKVKVLIVKDK